MSDLENKKSPVVITIARDFGAEGHEIGRILADELGIPLYDNELLVRASLRAGESLDKMAAYDERLAVENMAFLPDRYDARSYSDKLFQKMSQVILDLGETESCIIEGRLSDYLLRNNPNHIAVLVTAPFEDRVEIVRKKRGLNKKKGAKLVKQQQKAREAFYKRYSAGKWKMTSGKDIVVNRAKLGREGCKDVIAAAYRYKVAPNNHHQNHRKGDRHLCGGRSTGIENSPRRARARRGLCRLVASAAGDYSPSRLLVMEAAAFLPAPIARMTVAAPVTMSPPAQMRGSVVWPVSSSATM